MSVKVEKLSLRNFRAFPGPERVSIPLAGKNLLVYGENGAGKSSVALALEALFGSGRYADPEHAANRFTGLENAQVRIYFSDGSTVTHRISGNGDVTAHTTGTDHLPSARRLSAFLDYRALWRAQSIGTEGYPELFDLAHQDLLRTFVPVGPVARSVEDWMKEAQDHLPAAGVPIEAADRRRVEKACEGFNAAMVAALARTKDVANDILRELDPEGLQLVGDGFVYTGIRRDKRTIVPGSLRPIIEYRGQDVRKPSRLLNEARLTALALALFLASRYVSAAPGGEEPRLMVLDDVLIGLDLGHRLPLLDLLKNRFAEWQIVLLTHDRVWFDMASTRVKLQGGWQTVELHEGSRPLANPVGSLTGAMPAPIVHAVKPAGLWEALLMTANGFLGGGHIGAAANAARQAYEVVLKVKCDEAQVPVRYRLEARKATSEEYLAAWKTHLGEHKTLLHREAFELVEFYRTNVLNPLSHSFPLRLTRREVEGAMQAVRLLGGCNARAVGPPSPEATLAEVRAWVTAGDDASMALAAARLRQMFAEGLERCAKTHLTTRYPGKRLPPVELWNRCKGVVASGSPNTFPANMVSVLNSATDFAFLRDRLIVGGSPMTQAELNQALQLLAPAGATDLSLFNP